MTWLILGLAVFLGIHSVSILAPAARDRWATRMGANVWRGVYSVISLGGFVLLIWGYGVARQSPVLLYAPPLWLRNVTLLLMLPVFPLLIAGNLPGRIKATLKHPLLAGVKLWALAHLLSNGMLADVVLFGGFLAWAVLDRISFKRRTQRPIPSPPASRRNDVIAVVGGLAAYFAFVFWLHVWLLGAPVLPG